MMLWIFYLFSLFLVTLSWPAGMRLTTTTMPKILMRNPMILISPEEIDTENTIFVSIGSFRDVECADTIVDMMENARYPQNLFLGIAEQLNNNQETCLTDRTFKYLNQTRVIRHPGIESFGCGHARFLAASLYNREKYFLQIDSHSQFAKDWDVTLIKMLEDCPAKEKCVFTHYPPDQLVRYSGTDDVPCLCEGVYNDAEILSFRSRNMPVSVTRNWLQTPFLGGGLVFAYGKYLLDVPYDPNLPYFVDGDELLRAVRTWTSGYDLYSPRENILWHHYGRKGSPHLWEDYPELWNGYYATGKIRYYMKQDPNPRGMWYADWIPAYEEERIHYGLGKERSIEDYIAFAGIDFKNLECYSWRTVCKVSEQQWSQRPKKTQPN